MRLRLSFPECAQTHMNISLYKPSFKKKYNDLFTISLLTHNTVNDILIINGHIKNGIISWCKISRLFR